MELRAHRAASAFPHEHSQGEGEQAPGVLEISMELTEVSNFYLKKWYEFYILLCSRLVFNVKMFD